MPDDVRRAAMQAKIRAVGNLSRVCAAARNYTRRLAGKSSNVVASTCCLGTVDGIAAKTKKQQRAR